MLRLHGKDSDKVQPRDFRLQILSLQFDLYAKTFLDLYKKSKPHFPAFLQKTENPCRCRVGVFPLWVGGGLLSHGLPQYHRRSGA